MKPFAKGAVMLALLPPAPYGVALSTMHDRLADHGVEQTRRQTQRDLLALKVVGLAQNDGRRPARWWRT